MRDAFICLLLACLGGQASAEVCVGEPSSDGCSVALSVVPTLEEVGIGIADVEQYSALGSLEDGVPLASVTYILRSDPMKDLEILEVAERDLGAISSMFMRDMYRIQCGQKMRMGPTMPRQSFVQAGGAVQYEIILFLMDDTSRNAQRIAFGKTQISSCGG
jgi:hypothetical protein